MKERLKALRNSRKLTQTEFANELGVSLSNIQSYEIGRRLPSDAFIKLLCEKYNVNELWLTTGKGDMYRKLNREQEIAELTKDLLKGEESDLILEATRVMQRISPEDRELLIALGQRLAELNGK